MYPLIPRPAHGSLHKLFQMDLIYKIHTVYTQHDGIGQVGLQHMRGIRDRHTAVDFFLHHLKLGRIENMQGRGIDFPPGRQT